MTLQVAPGCEIHLVMGRPAQQLRVLDPSSGADASGVSTYTNFGAVVQQSGGLLTPVSAGETSGIIAFGGEQGVVPRATPCASAFSKAGAPRIGADVVGVDWRALGCSSVDASAMLPKP